ncbi:NUDIX hydrolase [Candidatus Woesearchaeota archaeon]|nr:NUDIX hydrolase [Candidatus Woesearchaeota archaeon]
MGSKNHSTATIIEVRASALVSCGDTRLVIKERNPTKTDKGKRGISKYWKTPGGRCNFAAGHGPLDRTSLDGLMRELHEEGFAPVKDTFTPAGVFFVEGKGALLTQALHFYRGDLERYPQSAAEVNEHANNPEGANIVTEVKYVTRDDAILHNVNGTYKELHRETLEAIVDTFRWDKSFQLQFTQREIDRRVDGDGNIIIDRPTRRVLLSVPCLHNYSTAFGGDAFKTLHVYCSLPVDKKRHDPKAKIFIASEMFLCEERISCTSLPPTADIERYRSHVITTVIKHLRKNLNHILASKLVDQYIRHY